MKSPDEPVTRDDLSELIGELQGRLFRALRRAASELGAEPVHRSRVAARTLRSLLTTLRPLLRPSLLSRARRDLRNLALELEAMREADVRRDWLLGLAAESGALPPGAYRQLELRLEEERRLARERFREHAESVAYRERVDRLRSTLADPRLIVAAAGLRPPTAQRLRRRWTRLRNSGTAAGSGDAQALHELRLAAKHARYASESLMPLLGVDPQPAVRTLKRLQRCLGDHRDAVQALAWLRGLGEPLTPVLLPRLEPPVRRAIARREQELGRLLAAIGMPDLEPAVAPVSRARRRPGGRSARWSARPRRRSRPS